MAATSLAFLLFAAAACSAFPQPDRIVGGQPATVQNYPSIVQVDYLSTIAWYQSCGGSILTSTIVVSAAHCFIGSSLEIRRIRAGATYRNEGGVVVYLSSVLNHPSYNIYTFEHDISILKLATPLTYSESIQSIPILAQGVEVPDNLPVTVAGWGLTSIGGSVSPVLLDANIFTINRQVCAMRYSNVFGTVTDNMICAGILDVGGQNFCQGDSGGPLYYDNILVGIISWSSACGDAFYPGVSARIASYTDWIISNAN